MIDMCVITEKDQCGDQRRISFSQLRSKHNSSMSEWVDVVPELTAFISIVSLWHWCHDVCWFTAYLKIRSLVWTSAEWPINSERIWAWNPRAVYDPIDPECYKLCWVPRMSFLDSRIMPLKVTLFARIMFPMQTQCNRIFFFQVGVKYRLSGYKGGHWSASFKCHL